MGAVGLRRPGAAAAARRRIRTALNPSHLKAICPWEGFTDIYRDSCTPGGNVEDGFTRIWLHQSHCIARTHESLGVERHDHPLQDAWWQSITPDLASIRVPKPPRLRLEVRDTREHIVEVRDENEWPLARTQRPDEPQAVDVVHWNG